MRVSSVAINPVAEKMKQLKWDHAQNMLLGNAKKAKESYREYAKLAIDNFEIATQIPSPIKGSTPLFSKTGLKILKYIIYDIFTKRTPEEKKALLNRLNRIEGQVRGLKRLVEENAYCTDIINQVMAVNSALNSVNKELLSEHIKSCVTEDIKLGQSDKTDELLVLLKKLMR